MASSRNLTDRSPFGSKTSNTSEESSNNLKNFQNTNTDPNGIESSSSSDRDVDGDRASSHYSKPEHKISLNNKSSTNSMLTTVGASSSLNLLGEFTPGKFDRYPQSISGSRLGLPISGVSSSNSSTQKLFDSKDKTFASESNSLIDEKNNSFLIDSEFSPFGGYPASQFPLHIAEKESDDYLHNPDPITDAEYEKHRFRNDLKNMDKRSVYSLLGFICMALGFLAVFVILPALTYTGVTEKVSGGTWNDTYIQLSEYTYPQLSSIRTSLIDPDTPDSVKTRQADDGSDWELVFSDEFNAEGRTFYDGDDQFWYAPDFYYGATRDLEWYDPDAVTTANGTVQFRMDAFNNHELFYRSGMLHSWNRMCFTQGVMEVSARLPNYGNVTGLWPGMWSMGNLGRPGYMATSDGVWPYTYEACDSGITYNQSSPDGISYLPGQRLNSCTCDGEDHPNQGKGRGAPEIDIIEGEVDTNILCGVASQSMQIAPMDIWYMPDYNWIEVHNASITTMNTYAGGPFQQAVSAITTLNTSWYEYGDTKAQFQKYAYEYLNDDDNGYCKWFVGDNATFTLHAQALSPNGNIDWRRISKEPMSMVLNLGISNNWAYIDWISLAFPVTLSVDYVRIYQPSDAVSVTCDPSDYPTYDYIEAHPEAYNNWNKTTWEEAGYSFPKNKLTGC